MTNEERLILLKQLQSNTPTRTSGEQAEIDREVAEIDATIEDYNEKIIELEEKLANMDNYQYQSPNAEERDMTIELLEESFVDQLAELERSDNEYKELQDIGTSISDSYDEEIATLNEEIASLERRIRKNDVAVQRNMRMQLSPEELSDLTAELESKRERLKFCKQMKEEYVAELKDYEELIAANNKKREIIVAKQSRLEVVKKDRVQEKTIDKHKLRLDQDELARLKAGVEALNLRKQSIMFDAKDKLGVLIADLEKEIDEEKAKLNGETSKGVDQMEESKEEDQVLVTTPIKDRSGNVVGVAKKKNPEFEDIYSNSDQTKEDNLTMEDIYSNSQDDPNYEENLLGDNDLDDEREATVEDSDPELVEKKKSEIVKEFLKNHWKKFVVALTAVIILATSVKGCNSLKEISQEDLNNELNNNTSIVQQEDDDEKDNDLNDNQNNNGSGNNTSTEPKPDIDSNPNPDVEPEPDVEPNPNPDVEPEPDIDPNPNQVELESGEAITTASDLVKGEYLEHGDEVGKTLDSGTNVSDYTAEGNMQVSINDNSTNSTVVAEKSFDDYLDAIARELLGNTNIESYEAGGKSK